MMLVMEISAEFYHCERRAHEEIATPDLPVDAAEHGVFIGFAACMARKKFSASSPRHAVDHRLAF